MPILLTIFFCFFLASGSMVLAQPASISLYSGNHQFVYGSAFPFTGYQALKVRVTDATGVPLPGTTVRFTVASPRGDVNIEGGGVDVVTDQSGIASWAGLKGVSGNGFFNVLANSLPALEKAAVFLLSQNADLNCALPASRFDTTISLNSSRNPAATAEQIRLNAVTRLVSSPISGPGFGEVAFVDSDRILAAQILSASDPGQATAVVTLASGHHFLEARFMTGCPLIGSVSAPLIQAVTSVNGPAFNYSDMWWNAAESGWGLSMIQHASGQMFVVWYHYRDDGSPQWLVIPAPVWTSATAFSGAIYRTSGPVFSGVFDPSRVSVVPVGIATVNFTATDRGTFSWSMDGVQGTKSIARQLF